MKSGRRIPWASAWRENTYSYFFITVAVRIEVVSLSRTLVVLRLQLLRLTNESHHPPVITMKSKVAYIWTCFLSIGLVNPDLNAALVTVHSSPMFLRAGTVGLQLAADISFSRGSSSSSSFLFSWILNRMARSIRTWRGCCRWGGPPNARCIIGFLA